MKKIVNGISTEMTQEEIDTMAAQDEPQEEPQEEQEPIVCEHLKRVEDAMTVLLNGVTDDG